MPAELKKIEVQVAKQVDDVMVLFREFAKVIKGKGDVTGLTDDLIVAIQGIDLVDDEGKEVPFRVAASVVNRGLEIAEALLSKNSDGAGEPVEEILGEPV